MNEVWIMLQQESEQKRRTFVVILSRSLRLRMLILSFCQMVWGSGVG